MTHDPRPPWPFVLVARHTAGGGSKTEPADVITWRGPLNGWTITFTSRPRTIDPHATFYVPSNARIHYTTMHPEFVDLCVDEPLSGQERAALKRLAEAYDDRPIVVRCRGERVRETPPTVRLHHRVRAAAQHSQMELFTDHPEDQGDDV